jgi:hypothetical protein
MPSARNTPQNGTDESTEIAKVMHGDVVPVRQAQQFKTYLNTRAIHDRENGNDAMAAQLEKILAASDGTFDEIMDADDSGVFESKDLIGAEIEIQGDPPIRIAESAEKYRGNGGLDVYVQFTAIMLANYPEKGLYAGDVILVSSGATLVIGKVRTLEAGGYLPARVMIRGSESVNGTVLKLGRIPERPISPPNVDDGTQQVK